MPLTRSENMARIKSADTKPEIRLRKALWRQGMRYRLHHKIERGIRPDIVFVKAKVAIFVDGCQWHGCPKHYVRPRTRNDFWGGKLLENVERDTRQTQLLIDNGWSVFRVWEHEVWEDLPFVVNHIREIIHGNKFPDQNDWRVFQVDVIDLEDDLEKRYMRRLTSSKEIKSVEQTRTTKKWNKNFSDSNGICGLGRNEA